MGWNYFKPKRRDFVFSSLKIAAASTLCPWPEKAQAKTRSTSYGRLSILQGVTTETTTQFTVDLPTNSVARFQAVDHEGRVIAPDLVKSARRDHSPWRVDKIFFSGLDLNHDYQLQVLGENNEALDFRGFQTLDLTKTHPQIGLYSCMKDSSFSVNKMWHGFLRHRPDLMFFLGDNVYGDKGGTPGPERLWERYIQTREAVPFYHFYQLTPVIATWDDHDYGENNQDGNYQHKEDSLNTFKAFYAQEPTDKNNIDSGPGCSSYLQAFGHQFFLFDGRYFRQESEGTFLGKGQLNWAYSKKNLSSGPAWMMCGNQFFGAYTEKEAFEWNAPEEFQKFLDEISTWSAPVTFVAGDKHYSEIMDIEPKRLGYPAIELTSSSMHSTTRPWAKDNPRRRSIHHHKNFMVVDIVPQASGFDGHLKIIKGRKIRHQDVIKVRKNKLTP